MSSRICSIDAPWAAVRTMYPPVVCCGIGFGHQRLQARALGFVVDARGHADAFAARHVHHEPRWQRHESS